MDKIKKIIKTVHPIVIISVILIILVITWFAARMIRGYIKYRHFKPNAVTVSTVVATKQNWYPRIEAVGDFVASKGVDINSEAQGTISRIYFQSGEYVDVNAPLVDLDDSTEQAVLKNHQAELVLKELNYKRQVDLLKRGATPGSSVDEAKANLDKAKADVEKTKSEIDEKHIKAPFAGVVGIRQVNLGQYITPGQTTIVTLQAMDPLLLHFYLPEHYYKRVHKGQPIQFRIEGFPSVLFQGEISAINSKVDVNTHNLQIEASLPNCPAVALNDPKHSALIAIHEDKSTGSYSVRCFTDRNKASLIHNFLLLPGMFTTLFVEEPSIPNVIVLPTTAISFSLYGNAVYVLEKPSVEQKDAQGRRVYLVKRRFVTTGEARGNLTVIKKGVNPGDVVVAAGDIKLQNDTPVVINNAVPLPATAVPGA